MSTPTTTRAPGWYADPAGGAGARWWDGHTWTGRRLLPSGVEPGVPLGPRFARLSDLLARMLVLNVCLGLFTLAVETWGHRLVDRDNVVSTVLAVACFALLVTTALFWCAWQWRLATSAPDVLRRTPALHVGSWFIPVAWLWMPIQNMTDLWFAYEPHDARHARPSGPHRLTRLPLMLPWWASWLVAVIVGGMGLRSLLHVPTLGGYLGVAAPGAVASAATTLAALLAWVVVRRLGWRALTYHSELDLLPFEERTPTL